MQKEYFIKKPVLEMIIHAARNAYPKEFIGLLGSRMENGVIDDFILIPATYGDSFSSVYLDMMPIERGIIGSVHSHPSPANNPSFDDVRTFPKLGKIHLIIAYPFNINNIKMFDAKGHELKFKVIG